MASGLQWVMLLFLVGISRSDNDVDSFSLGRNERRKALSYVERSLNNVLDGIPWQELCKDDDGGSSQCEDRIRKYVTSLLDDARQRRGKRISLRNVPPPLCPQNMDRLECFERYMAFIVRFHPRFDGSAKRGAMSSPESSVAAPSDVDEILAGRLCPVTWSKLKCFTELLNLAPADVVGRTRPSSGNELSSGGLTTKLKKATELSSLCPSNVDPLTCFKGYFAYYISRGSEMKMVGRSTSHFYEDKERLNREPTDSVPMH